MASHDARLSKFEADFKQQQSELTNKINTVLKAITDRIAGALPSEMVKNLKLSTSIVLSALSYPTIDPQCSTHIHGSINAITIYPKQQGEPHNDKPEDNKEEEKENPEKNPWLVPKSSNTELVCIKGDDGDVMFIEIVKINDHSHKEEPEVEEQEVEYFDIFPTRSELAYHKYLMCGPIPSIFLRNPIITEGCPSNLKIPCNIGHVHVEKSYIDPNSPLNIMTLMIYNWIMKRKLDPRENSDRGVSNFTRRIKDMHVFIGNFTYIINFMIVEDISSIIDPRVSQLVLERPFVEISNMTHEPPERVLRNEEDKRSGVEYVMNKILGFYKECLDLGPEYATGMDDEGEVTKFLIKNEEEIFTDAGDGVRIYPNGVASPAMLYLTRRSLEILRKFHWTILGGRFNQLSHVSSPLLRKPGEY
ncbi:hypothetical protein Tco_0157738 [Tanacetum coccineum]